MNLPAVQPQIIVDTKNVINVDFKNKKRIK
jgi:hypothetical protein